MKIYRKIRLSVLLAITLMLCGCGGLADVKDDTITVSAKGAVREAIVGDGEKNDYSIEELRSFVEEDIEEYNQNAKSGNIDLKSCEMKDGIIRIEIAYASYVDYAAYHKTTLFYGTLKEAKSKGFDFNTEFVDNNGDTAAAATILAHGDEWHVVILEEPVDVQVSGDILYVSKNAEITGKRKAKIADEKDEGAERITTDSLVYLIYK